MLTVIQYFFDFSWANDIITIFGLVFVYCVWKIAFLTHSFLAKRNLEAKDKLRAITSSVLFIFIWMGVAFIPTSLLVKSINQAPDTERILAQSDAFFLADIHLFGVSPPFWLQDKNNPFKKYLDLLAPTFIYTYVSLVFILALVFFALLFKDYFLFKKFLAAFSICSLLGLPFWYAYPAISPLDRYELNIAHAEIPPYVQKTQIQYDPNPLLSYFLKNVEDVNPEKIFAITTFPSMHVAWSFVILFFAGMAYSWSLWFFIPYFIVNFISTIYTLQHYAVDLPAGLMVGILAVTISHFLFREKRNSEINLTTILQSDFKWVIAFIPNGFLRQKQRHSSN